MYERYLDVYRAVDYFEEVMGKDWLEECLKLLKSYAGGGGSFGRGIDFASCNVSAAAYYWYRAREELALASIGGQRPGLYALQAAALGDDLLALKGSEELSNRIEGLKRPADAGDVITELVIASGYARSGRPVVFTNAGEGFRVFGPELRALLAHHNRCPGSGNPGTESMSGGETGTLGNHQTAPFSVIYRYEHNRSLSLNSAPLNHRSERADYEVGELVVDCDFVARQGRKGPEIIHRGRLTGDQQSLAKYIYIPNEIIIPAWG